MLQFKFDFGNLCNTFAENKRKRFVECFICYANKYYETNITTKRQIYISEKTFNYGFLNVFREREKFITILNGHIYEIFIISCGCDFIANESVCVYPCHHEQDSFKANENTPNYYKKALQAKELIDIIDNIKI